MTEYRYLDYVVNERCSSKNLVTKAATVQCVECPFRKDAHYATNINSRDARTSDDPGIASDKPMNFPPDQKEEFISAVAAQSRPFSCHMRRSQHCFGAQKVQPDVAIPYVEISPGVIAERLI